MCDDDTNPNPFGSQLLGRIGDLFTNLDHQVGTLIGQQAQSNETLHELRQAFARAIFTRTRPADRFWVDSLSSVPVDRPQRILGENPARASLAVRNTSTTVGNIAWIAPSEEAARNMGAGAFPLYGGDWISIPSTAEVWVFAASGSAPGIAWVSAEYDLAREVI